MADSLASGTLARSQTIQYLPLPTATANPGIKLTFRDSRVFVPIAQSGCGVACKYCYIPAPASGVVPLSPGLMCDLLEQLRTFLQRPDEPRPIMAIGCDTEVGVSTDLADNVLRCLDFAVTHDLPVQLATKFPLSQPLRETLGRWPADAAPPIVFTTITTAAMSQRLEPNAPTPAERSANFADHSPSWRSYALIKPFLPTSADDKDSLIDLLAMNRPDGVVVGVRYRRRHSLANRGDPHPIAPDWIANLPSESAKLFIARLSDLGLRVFMNTQCASSWHDPSLDSSIVRDKYPHLCVQCGRCR